MQNKALVYLVDDDDEVIKAISWLLDSVSYEVMTFNNPTKFINAYDPTRLSCLLLDVRMPGMTGLELQEQLNDKNIVLPIIFMTAHGDVPMSVRAMKNGAFDFLTKPINPQTLLEAVNKAIAFDSQQRKTIIEKDLVEQQIAKLTPREKNVLELLVKGLVNKQIASQLEISANTVEVHRANITKKMAVKSVAELIHLLASHDLI